MAPSASAIFFALDIFTGISFIEKSDSAILSKIFSYMAHIISAGARARLSSLAIRRRDLLKKCFALKCMNLKSSLQFGFFDGSARSSSDTPKASSSSRGIYTRLWLR